MATVSSPRRLPQPAPSAESTEPVTAPDGPFRIESGSIRLPDISFSARASQPDGKNPKGPVARTAPDLAVEVLSKSNTKAEIARKLREYFASGTRLAWIVDPKKQA